MAEYIEGQVYPEELKRIGNSYYILIDEDKKKYLGIDGNEEKAKLIIKADNGKFGRFFGLGIDRRR